MSRLGVQLGVDDFEAYRAKMLAAQRLAVDTQRVINGMQNPTFGNAVQISSAFKQMPIDARQAANQVDAIMKATAANKKTQDLIMAASSKSLADAQIREAKRTADGLSPHIARARAEQAQLARTSDALATLQGRDIASGGPLSGEQKYGRINLARQGADVFTQLGSGQGVGITAIQQGPQIVEAMALSGLKLSSSMAATAVAVGGIAAAGFAVVKWSESVRADAERRLKVEEQITAAWNKQAQQMRDVVAEREKFNKLQAAAAGGRAIDRDIAFMLEAGNSDQIRIAQRRFQAEIDVERKYDGQSDGSKAKIAENEARIANLNIQLEQRSRTGFQPGETKSYWDDQSRKAQAFAEDVKKAQDRVKEIGESWRKTYSDLTVRTYDDNPFVKIFVDARSEMGKFRNDIKGLPAEIQAAMIASQQNLNSRQLFSARVDSAMNSFDLRELAARYRDDTPQRRAFAQSGLDRQISGDERRIGMGGVNVDAIRDYQSFRQRLIDRQFRVESPADRLDRQFNALDRLDPRTTGEQAILDQRILRTASGIDPAQLNASSRERIAQTADRLAEREERRFQEALTVQKEMAASLKMLSGEEKGLDAAAQKGGLQAVEIRIRNESDSTLDIKRPTQEDTNRAFANLRFDGSY